MDTARSIVHSVTHYIKNTDLYLMLLGLVCSIYGMLLIYSATLNPVTALDAQSGGRRNGGRRNRCNRRPAGKRGWNYADNQYSARKKLMFHVKHFCSTGGRILFHVKHLMVA